jgi:hypothetical protein
MHNTARRFYDLGWRLKNYQPTAQAGFFLALLLLGLTNLFLNYRLQALEVQNTRLELAAQYVYVSECLTHDWAFSQDIESLRAMFCPSYQERL